LLKFVSILTRLQRRLLLTYKQQMWVGGACLHSYFRRPCQCCLPV